MALDASGMSHLKPLFGVGKIDSMETAMLKGYGDNPEVGFPGCKYNREVIRQIIAPATVAPAMISRAIKI